MSAPSGVLDRAGYFTSVVGELCFPVSFTLTVYPPEPPRSPFGSLHHVAARGPTVAAVYVVHRGEGVRARFEAAGDTYGQHGYDGNRSLGEQHGDGHLLRVLHAEGRGVPDRGVRRLESSLR